MWNQQLKTDSCLTQSIACCLGGGVAASVGSSVFHLICIPDTLQQFASKFLPRLKKQMTRLQTLLLQTNAAEKPHAFLIGGHQIDENTIPVFKKLESAFTQQNIPFTYFLNSDQPTSCSIYHSASNNTWYVKYDFLGPICSVQDLLKRYKNIHVAPEDEVYINNQKVFIPDTASEVGAVQGEA